MLGLWRRIRRLGRIAEPAPEPPSTDRPDAAEQLGGSVQIRHVDAGSCNGCEIEIGAAFGPVHDGERYDWEAGDLVLVHNDSVHQHFNPYDEPALTIVFKTKPTWMFLGLTAQGRHTPPDRLEGFGPREDWSQLWTPGASELKKVIKSTDREWEETPYGKLKQFTGPGTDARTFSVDIAELEIPPGGRSGKRWQMADEACYILEGSGYSLHWEVRAEFAEKYYAHIALEPTRHEFSAGQLLYIPPNTVAQHFADEGSVLRMVSGQSRVFRNLGYDSTVYLEKAPG